MSSNTKSTPDSEGFERLSASDTPEYLRSMPEDDAKPGEWQTVGAWAISDLVYRVNEVFPIGELTPQQKNVLEELLTYLPVGPAQSDILTITEEEPNQRTSCEHGVETDNSLEECSTFLIHCSNELRKSLDSCMERYENLEIECKEQSFRTYQKEDLYAVLQLQSNTVVNWMMEEISFLLNLLMKQSDYLSFSLRHIQLAFGRSSVEALPIRHLDRMFKREIAGLMPALKQFKSLSLKQRQATLIFTAIFSIPQGFEEKYHHLKSSKDPFFSGEAATASKVVENFRIFAMQMRLIFTDSRIEWRGAFHKIGHLIRALRGKALEIAQKEFIKPLLETDHPENADWTSILDILSPHYDPLEADQMYVWLAGCASPGDMEEMPQFRA